MRRKTSSTQRAHGTRPQRWWDLPPRSPLLCSHVHLQPLSTSNLQSKTLMQQVFRHPVDR